MGEGRVPLLSKVPSGVLFGLSPASNGVLVVVHPLFPVPPSQTGQGRLDKLGGSRDERFWLHECISLEGQRGDNGKELARFSDLSVSLHLRTHVPISPVSEMTVEPGLARSRGLEMTRSVGSRAVSAAEVQIVGSCRCF